MPQQQTIRKRRTVPPFLLQAIREVRRQMGQCWVVLSILAVFYSYYGMYAPAKAAGEKARVTASLEQLQQMQRQFAVLRLRYIDLMHPTEARELSTIEYIRIFHDDYVPRLRTSGFRGVADSLVVALSLLQELIDQHALNYCPLCMHGRIDSLSVEPLDGGDVTLKLALLCKLRRATVICQGIFNSASDAACRESLATWLRPPNASAHDDEMASTQAPARILKASLIETFVPFNSLRSYGDNSAVHLDDYQLVGTQLGIARPVFTVQDLHAVFRDVSERAQQVSASLSPDLVSIPILNTSIETRFILSMLPLMVLALTVLLSLLAGRLVELEPLAQKYLPRNAERRVLWEAVLAIVPEPLDRSGRFRTRPSRWTVALSVGVVLAPIAGCLIAGASSILQMGGIARAWSITMLLGTTACTVMLAVILVRARKRWGGTGS